ncbi:MAG TPA: helix-turn-helix domain-containing protein [Pseudonocardia sp.]
MSRPATGVNRNDERRTDTREQIRDVALELFAERGYEKTSLREIAERLGVTKAAVYYHYRTKEEILESLFSDLRDGIEEIVAWGGSQPAGQETRRAVLARYSRLIGDRSEHFGRLARFMQQSQSSIRELAVGVGMEATMETLVDLLVGAQPSVEHRLRGRLALIALHLGAFKEDQAQDDPGERQATALRIASELV